VINAVVDALRHAVGLTHIDMPATPERVWEALAPQRNRAAAE
jgi:carbon-monoxide dehydrogenase large subunit